MAGITIHGDPVYYLLWSIDLRDGSIYHYGVFDTTELAWDHAGDQSWLHFNVHECVYFRPGERKIGAQPADKRAVLKSNPDIATVAGGSKRQKRKLRDYILGKQKQREPRGWMAPREGGYRPRKGQQKVSVREPVIQPPTGSATWRRPYNASS